MNSICNNRLNYAYLICTVRVYWIHTVATRASSLSSNSFMRVFMYPILASRSVIARVLASFCSLIIPRISLFIWSKEITEVICILGYSCTKSLFKISQTLHIKKSFILSLIKFTVFCKNEGIRKLYIENKWLLKLWIKPGTSQNLYHWAKQAYFYGDCPNYYIPPFQVFFVPTDM